VGQFLGRLRLIQVLYNDGEILHGQRNGRSLQQQQNHGEQERQHHGEAVAEKLRQFFSCLRENSPHDSFLSKPSLEWSLWVAALAATFRGLKNEGISP
jgi:hypothetical protein